MSEQIKALSEKEKVRRKISVWLGASNHIAVTHTVKELVGNSVDEINKGNGSHIRLILHNEKTITVMDDCKGLPFEGINENGIENYKLLTETLFAGTKYENGINNNDYTVGTNGVFLTVLTFSSENIEFEVARPDGNVYRASYQKGDAVQPLEVVGKSKETFTKIKYSLDDQVYEDNYFTITELCQIASEQASLIKGTITVIDEEGGQEHSFHYENGIVELLENRTEGLTPLHEIIQFQKNISFETTQEGEKVTDDMKMNVAILYTKEDEEPTQIEFLNGSNLIHHGTIYDGLVAGMRTVINNYLKSQNLYNKNEKQITKDDLLVGLNYIVDFKSYFPTYANQTKFASYIKYYEATMKKAIESHFEHFVVENKDEMNLIALQVLTEKRSRESAEKTRLDVRKKLEGTVNNLTSRIDGFVNCKSKDSTKNELYVVEGKSALGSTQQGRDKDIQAIYALRGKILNCLKADYEKIFKNEIIVDLVKLLGCGIEVKSKHAKELNTFKIENLRWSKIIIATDADVDGFHIRTLLLTVIYALMPSLIEHGKVFIAESPLYEIEKDDVSVFAYSDKEKDEIVSKMKGDVSVQRSKGLGENTAEMMWDSTMNPETRRLVEVTPSDAEETLSVFELFLGADLDGRKKYIEDNLHHYIDEALEG